jgi:hypothetical protein
MLEIYAISIFKYTTSKMNILTTHGPMNVKVINAQQAKETYQYRNIKRKLCKTNAAVWYNKTCRDK